MNSLRLRLATATATALVVAALPLLAACQAKQESIGYEGPYKKEVSAAIPAIEKSIGLKFKRMPKVETKSEPSSRKSSMRTNRPSSLPAPSGPISSSASSLIR
jgi:hypothetical protein